MIDFYFPPFNFVRSSKVVRVNKSDHHDMVGTGIVGDIIIAQATPFVQNRSMIKENIIVRKHSSLS